MPASFTASFPVLGVLVGKQQKFQTELKAQSQEKKLLSLAAGLHGRYVSVRVVYVFCTCSVCVVYMFCT